MNIQCKKIIELPMLLALVVGVSGCSGLQTFGNVARAGDTISAYFSYNNYKANHANRENTSITIVDNAGVQTVYEPGDQRIKAILKMYPDPASYLVVASETNQNFRSSEVDMAGYIGNLNSNRHDWGQMVAYFDLPETMATGTAAIMIKTDDYYTATSAVEVLSGQGSSHTFDIQYAPSNITSIDRIQSLERSPHHKVVLKGTAEQLPSVQALDVKFSHDPDVNNGGSGTAHIVNPRGDITSINWTDNGTMLHVIVTPTKSRILRPRSDLLFYIAGGLKGLQLDSISVFDINGASVPDVGISMSPLIYSLSPSGSLAVNTEVTMLGDALCVDCASPDTKFYLAINGVLQEVTPTTLTSSSLTFNMPQQLIVGDVLVVWMESAAGEVSKIIKIQ